MASETKNVARCELVPVFIRITFAVDNQAPCIFGPIIPLVVETARGRKPMPTVIQTTDPSSALRFPQMSRLLRVRCRPSATPLVVVRAFRSRCASYSMIYSCPRFISRYLPKQDRKKSLLFILYLCAFLFIYGCVRRFWLALGLTVLLGCVLVTIFTLLF